MSSRDEADRLARRTALRRQQLALNRAAILPVIEFFDGQEVQVWQIQRADGTTDVRVAADLIQPQ